MMNKANKDKQSITSDWEMKDIHLISGVLFKEMKNVIKENGYLTELFRTDWSEENKIIDQVFKVELKPGSISAWHTHQFTTDRIAIMNGTIKLVLYDGREDSPSHGIINEFKISTLRPATVIIPPQVWHGIQNIGHTPGIILNMVDRAYQYEDPDHWRLPPDTTHIPYKFNNH